MMINRKLIILIRTIKLVYTLRPFRAISRDVLFVVTTILEMSIISISGRFIDATANLLGTWESFSFRDYIFSDSARYLFLGLFFWLLIRFCDTVREYFMDDITRYVTYEMQTSLLNVISKSNLEDVETKEFRDLLTFVPNFSYENIIAAYAEFSFAARSLLRSIVALGILIPYVGFSALILPLLAIPENIAADYQRTKRKKFNDGQVENLKRIDYLQNIMTRIQYFAELRVNNSFTSLKRRYKEIASHYMKGLLRQFKRFYITVRLFATVGRILMMSYVIFSLAFAVVQRLSIGTFKAIYDYIVTSYEASYDFFWALFKMANHLDYAEQYFSFIDFQGFGEREHGTKKLKSRTPRLHLKNLTYYYPGSRRKVLNAIDITIEPGKYVAFVGADGAGKSSLVRILCGLYKIVEGDYLINGISIKNLDRGELKKHMTVVFQDFVNYNLTLRENITLMSDRKRIKKSLYANSLKISGIEEMLEDEHLKDNQVLGKYFAGGKEITPGYWQKLAIARAIYRDKNIFLLDEPFLYIDEKSRGKILKKLMKFLNRKKTLIYVTQDEDFLELFDEVYYIKKGKLFRRRVR